MAVVREGVAMMGAPGFDDAPLVVIPRGEKPKTIQLVYPYYDNPKFLETQVRMWRAIPLELRRMMELIVVDDGSPHTPAEKVLRGLDLPFIARLFRIEVDVRWNWLAARNIGMFHAKEGWCVLTDMDHVVDESLARSLVEGSHDPNVIYRFQRREHTGQAIHPHPNSMFMTRAMFWRVGGYDEALSGHYGTDGDWRRRCAATARVRTLPGQLIRYEYVGDSSTIGYQRKQPEDAGKKAIIARRTKGWRPKTLSFPYHEVELC